MDLNTLAGVVMFIALIVAMIVIYRTKPGMGRHDARTDLEDE